jgi:hypothetical protein
VRRRVGVALVASVVAVLGVAGPASALLVWTLVGTPLVATAGQPTTFTLTATNLDLIGELGCLEVELPGSGWTEVDDGQAVPSTGRDDWTMSVSGTTVIAWSTSGGGRLETGQWVTFTFTARPTVAGISTWPGHAHQRQDCTGADEGVLPLAITVAPAILATPTPSPVPTPAPTAQPTPRPTPPPTAGPTSTARPTSLPTPGSSGDALPAPSDDPSARPTASLDGATDPTAGAPPDAVPAKPSERAAPGSAVAGAGGSPPSSTRIVYEEARLDVSLGPLGTLAALDVWIVPAATFAGPGLVILAWIALQALGVLAWLPAVRRLRGDDEAPRR